MRILFNANIYTLNPSQPKATAIAIDHDRILTVGDDQAILDAFPSKAERIDLAGLTVIPGICDAHIHLQQYALSLNRINCETPSRGECLKRVVEQAQKSPPDEWVMGHGWNHNDWIEGIGNPGDLDTAVPDHPVYLTAKSLHAAWVNRAALIRAGIDANTPDPPGGRIGRDEHGSPTGLLFESALQLVASRIPEPGKDRLVEVVRVALEILAHMGITSLHDFDRRGCLQALQNLHTRGDLKLRVIKSIPMDDLSYAIGMGIRTGFGDDFLRIGGVKLFADGALGPRTAAMIEPYQSEPTNNGMLVLDADELYERGRAAVENGISVCIHAIGDLANREALDAIEKLRAYEATLSLITISSSLRHRIEHVQLLHPTDTSRLARLGVIASMQPIHAISDMQMADTFWGERAAHAYAWQELLGYGTVLAFGSDAPVETPDPFQGLHAAVTRRRHDWSPGLNGWHPEQRLSMIAALNAYCTGPAYSAGLENRLGRLAPGYLADLILLDRDMFTCEPGDLLRIHPLATMVAGEWVFKR